MWKWNRRVFERFVRVATDARQEAGWTQGDVAGWCEVTHQTVSNFESGKCFNYRLLAFYLLIVGSVSTWLVDIFTDGDKEDELDG